MKPSRLHCVPPPPKRPPYWLIKKACRQFKGSYGPRLERHENIRKWLAAMERLGESWLLAKRHSVKRKVA